MSARRLACFAAAAIGGGALGVLVAAPVAAHALGETFQLPVPLWLYLAGAGTAVAASFGVTAITAREPSPEPRYLVKPIPVALSRFASVALAVLGMVWWYGAILAGFTVGQISPLPSVLLWVGIWIAMPIVAVLIGNPWPSFSPFRTTMALLERVVRAIGLGRPDVGLAYPRRLARWPAVALLGAALYGELILPGNQQPSTIAAILLGYTVLTLAGMISFGRIAWLRHAELFEVLLGWFGRIGPIGRRVVDPRVCADCEERCSPERCVDCPECATVAEGGERRAELRPWFAGLTEVRGAGWSDATFILLALAGVSYDGLRETVAWAPVIGFLLEPLLTVFGATEATFILVEVIGLGIVLAGFLAAFTLAIGLGRTLGPSAVRRSFNRIAGDYAATLLPIAGGYLLAHNLSLVIQGGIWLPSLIADPNVALAPDVSWIPIKAVWYLSVGAIVIGHVAAVVLAHRLAVRDAPRRAVVAGLPLVALMVGYTVFSLWIIAQPITADPGVPAPAAMGLQ